MIDLKVVAAVLVTLLGIAAGMGQGAIQQGDLVDLKDLPQFIGKLKDFSFDWDLDLFAQKNGKDKIAINASLKRDQLQEFELTFSQPAENLKAVYSSSSKSIKISGIEIAPKGEQGELKLTNYRGSIKLGSKINLDGKCSAAELNDVSFNSSTIKVSTTGFEPNFLRLTGTPPLTLNFEQVSGDLWTETRNTAISLESRDLDIIGFAGDITIDMSDNTYQLFGNASKVMSVGGQPEIVLK